MRASSSPAAPGAEARDAFDPAPRCVRANGSKVSSTLAGPATGRSRVSMSIGRRKDYSPSRGRVEVTAGHVKTRTELINLTCTSASLYSRYSPALPTIPAKSLGDEGVDDVPQL